MDAGNPKNRDAWLDNARFVLVALVIFGHTIELAWAWKPWLYATYKWLYVFHIPALAFVSGAVAKAELTTNTLRGIFTRLLVPLALCQGIAWALGHIPGWPGPPVALWVHPWWLLWYLLALALWRVMLPGFMALKPGPRWLLAISLALLASFLAGLKPTSIRTLVFFPMFLAGHLWASKVRALAISPWSKLAGIAGLAMLFLLVSHFRTFNVHWVFGDLANGGLKAHGWAALSGRGLQLVAAAFGAFCVLLAIPMRNSWITAPGQRSMGSYIIHGFLLKAAVGFGFGVWFRHLPWVHEASLAAFVAVVACWLLATCTVERLSSPVLSPAWAKRLLA